MSFVACIGIIGPDNAPILISKNVKCFPEKPRFEFDTLLSSGLDNFESAFQSRRSPMRNPDRFIGTIQTVGQYVIWGYKAILGYKIIIITSNVPGPQDSVVRGLCDKIKDLFFDCVLDPFYAPFAMIESTVVRDKISGLVESVQANQT
jgi:hypothetical protein